MKSAQLKNHPRPWVLSAVLMSAHLSAAAEPMGNNTDADAAEPDAAEKVELDSIQEKYWARGNEGDLGVVQNRTHTKRSKFAFSLLGGVISTDPFLSVQSVGGSLGYHFTEYFSIHLTGWKHFVSPSAALESFEEQLGAPTNTNPPHYYLGTEAVGSLLYGKLSVMGAAIIYYDFHLLGGLGMTATESGRYFSPSAGIGQQVYLGNLFAIRFDYRILGYQERIVEKVIPTKLGELIGTRMNWNHSISLGLTILIDFFGGELR